MNESLVEAMESEGLERNLVDAELEELKRLAAPLSEFLLTNFNPHTYVIVSTTDAEVVMGQLRTESVKKGFR